MVRYPQTQSLPQTKRRITYKTRLRVIVGDVVECRKVDAEEEEYRLLQRSLGVDKEDIDEKHLQDVLLEAEHTHVGHHEPKAFIPTPRSTKTAPDDALHAHYSSRKWDHPQSYICFSDTVDEAVKAALDHGSTYYMDERDKVWLDRNNQDARGESTSTNPCTISSPASPKGKEPEATVAAIKLSEDEFELVMGLFELITHEQTMLLHHNLELGMEFPSFLMYQDYLSQPLTSRVFAKLWAPSWIPRPPQLVAMAAVVYPHWRARRLDRRGHPIIPTLNFDGSDVLNEGYVCFRQREVKAVRRTRASQASPLDKMLALQRQLQQPLEIVQTLAKRESLRQASAQASCNIWLARLEMVELRLNAPELASKADDTMFVDVNQNVMCRPPIRLRVPPSIKHEVDIPAPTGRKVFPRDRTRMLSNQVDLEFARREQKDMDWEDTVDNISNQLPSLG
ncbi:hypothetical protein CYLTODRAFT_452585 [Cylindrobasidium torrendii FP15055 ss-10]|uniref:Enhancer of polycomb-like protein n=1 Tax=Cylindrobasidium torrendii FP15055 ss-10 TaxID=1314674 RepID=A0A0D7BG29_9AGAR|nr:hypothetical protein CYLTODRAFT_452585 [Cylindrobasidium torrendii FP15055 ss-10]